jgi:hypothetical protein
VQDDSTAGAAALSDHAAGAPIGVARLFLIVDARMSGPAVPWLFPNNGEIALTH